MAAYKKNYRLIHNEVDFGINIRPSDNHTISTGVSGILYMLDRGEYLPLNNQSIVSPINFGNEKGIESAIYVSDEWKITPLITLLGGLRYNLYSYLGPQSVYKYQPNAPLIPPTITDTLYFENNEPIKTYGGLDYANQHYRSFANRHMETSRLQYQTHGWRPVFGRSIF